MLRSGIVPRSRHHEVPIIRAKRSTIAEEQLRIAERPVLDREYNAACITTT